MFKGDFIATTYDVARRSLLALNIMFNRLQVCNLLEMLKQKLTLYFTLFNAKNLHNSLIFSNFAV